MLCLEVNFSISYYRYYISLSTNQYYSWSQGGNNIVLVRITVQVEETSRMIVMSKLHRRNSDQETTSITVSYYSHILWDDFHSNWFGSLGEVGIQIPLRCLDRWDDVKTLVLMLMISDFFTRPSVLSRFLGFFESDDNWSLDNASRHIHYIWPFSPGLWSNHCDFDL